MVSASKRVVRASDGVARASERVARAPERMARALRDCPCSLKEWPGPLIEWPGDFMWRKKYLGRGLGPVREWPLARAYMCVARTSYSKNNWPSKEKQSGDHITSLFDNLLLVQEDVK